jgi:hypothetical protein
MRIKPHIDGREDIVAADAREGEVRMTPEVETIAHKWLEQAKADLKRHGNFHPMVAILSESAVDVICIDGNMMNDRSQKDEVVDMIRERCRKANAYATVFLSDVFFAATTNAGEAKRRAIEQMLGVKLDVEQMEAAGLVVKREAIMIVVQVKGQPEFMIRQAYRRLPAGGIQLEECDEHEGRVHDGRMAGWLE